MPHLPIASSRLHYLRLGDERASSKLLLVHGAGGDASHWPAAELDGLRGVEVYVLELPGHGRSAGAGRRCVDGYADAVVEAVAALGLTDVWLGGHSMGGAVAQTVALRRPPWLRGLLLVATGSRLKVMPALLTQLETDFPAAVEVICSALFGPHAERALVDAERRRYLDVDWRLIRDDFIACNGFDVGARLAEIDCPTQVLVGADDVLTPVKYAQALAQAIPGARLMEVPDCGHLLPRERPAALVGAIKAFIDGGSA